LLLPFKGGMESTQLQQLKAFTEENTICYIKPPT